MKTKQRSIQFNDDGGEELNTKHLHALMNGGPDYTLCGITLDGDPHTAGSFKTVNKLITCPDCIQVIQHCARLRYNLK